MEKKYERNNCDHNKQKPLFLDKTDNGVKQLFHHSRLCHPTFQFRTSRAPRLIFSQLYLCHYCKMSKKWTIVSFWDCSVFNNWDGKNPLDSWEIPFAEPKNG